MKRKLILCCLGAGFLLAAAGAAGAEGVLSCAGMQQECVKQCNEQFPNTNGQESFGCLAGCVHAYDLCMAKQGKEVTASLDRELFPGRDHRLLFPGSPR